MAGVGRIQFHRLVSANQSHTNLDAIVYLYKQNISSNCLPKERFTGKCRIMDEEKITEIYTVCRTTLHH